MTFKKLQKKKDSANLAKTSVAKKPRTPKPNIVGDQVFDDLGITFEQWQGWLKCVETGGKMVEYIREIGVSYAAVMSKAKANDSYARARDLAIDARADALAELTLKVANDSSNDMYMGQNCEMPNSAAVARSKLVVDTLKFHAEKLSPVRWGAKIDVTSGGEVLKMPATQFVIGVIPTPTGDKSDLGLVNKSSVSNGE